MDPYCGAGGAAPYCGGGGTGAGATAVAAWAPAEAALVAGADATVAPHLEHTRA